MWKRVKSAGRFSRPDFECGSVRRVQEEFQNQIMNVEAWKECRSNFKIGLWMWRHVKNEGRILRPDYKRRSVQRMQEEFQYQTMNVELCEESRKNVKARLWMWKQVKSAARISRQDYECGSVQRVQKYFKTRQRMWKCANSFQDQTICRGSLKPYNCWALIS